jgi:beta-lactamase regulating signal transducer with metallopeptidase domain
MRTARRTATPIAFDLPIPVLSSSTRLEPGVLGIRKPVLLLPDGITNRLTPAQLAAIVTHEMCHIRRRDNLTAAMHMTVEVLFWFYPLVLWIRKGLIEERERACDEEVLAQTDPRIYAESILNVCRYYVESPLVCASGITGSDLKKRIEKIICRAMSSFE